VAVLAFSIVGMSNAAVIEITKENTQPLIKRSKDKVLVVDFYADWCNPCNLMAPVFEALAKKLDNTYLFARADFSELQEWAKELDVDRIPTFVVFKDGAVVGKISGQRTQEQLEEKILELISGVDLNALSKEQLQERMSEALVNFNVEEIKQIIQVKGFDINAPFTNGVTPLFVAVSMAGYLGEKGIEIVQIMLDAGANPELMVTIQGESSSSIDFARKSFETTKHLLEGQQKVITRLEEHIKKTNKK